MRLNTVSKIILLLIYIHVRFNLLYMMTMNFAAHAAKHALKNVLTVSNAHQYAETLRTVAFRLNSDQGWDVYDEFGKEIEAYNKELLNGDDMRAAAILGLSN